MKTKLKRNKRLMNLACLYVYRASLREEIAKLQQVVANVTREIAANQPKVKK